MKLMLGLVGLLFLALVATVRYIGAMALEPPIEVSSSASTRQHPGPAGGKGSIVQFKSPGQTYNFCLDASFSQGWAM